MAEVLAYIYVAVKMITKELTDEELNVIYMVGLLGTDPRQVIGYEKARPLFTEANETKMHPTTKDALTVIWNERFP